MNGFIWECDRCHYQTPIEVKPESTIALPAKWTLLCLGSDSSKATHLCDTCTKQLDKWLKDYTAIHSNRVIKESLANSGPIYD